MFPMKFVFIKLMLFLTKKPLISIVYQNELTLEYTPIVKVVFQVIKYDDGRIGKHIRIVYGMNELGKTLSTQGEKTLCL